MILYLWQSEHTPHRSRAVWNCGRSCHYLAGGLAAVVDAKGDLHGVLAPEKPDLEQFPWFGIAVVMKDLNYEAFMRQPSKQQRFT